MGDARDPVNRDLYLSINKVGTLPAGPHGYYSNRLMMVSRVLTLHVMYITVRCNPTYVFMLQPVMYENRMHVSNTKLN